MLAQLLIRKLGSFIRLWRVILLRSDMRLTTSGIRYASFMANKITRDPQVFISLSRKRQYHSYEVGISLLYYLPICVIMGLTKSLALLGEVAAKPTERVRLWNETPSHPLRGSSPKGRAFGCVQP